MSKIKGIEPVVGHAHTRAVPLAQDPEITKLKKTLLKDIRRSAYVYRVDCGGCNACEIEIFATITPLFDAERFGIKVVASPRHADILLFTGAVTRAMRVPALRAYEAERLPAIRPGFRPDIGGMRGQDRRTRAVHAPRLDRFGQPMIQLPHAQGPPLPAQPDHRAAILFGNGQPKALRPRLDQPRR